MNAIAKFRLCKLTDDELLQKIDEQTDKMFTEQKVPLRHIPAQPNNDYDLIIGELVLRFMELKEKTTTRGGLTKEEDAERFILLDKQQENSRSLSEEEFNRLKELSHKMTNS